MQNLKENTGKMFMKLQSRAENLDWDKRRKFSMDWVEIFH